MLRDTSIEALKIIQAVTVEFVKTVSRKKGYSATVIDQAGGKIFTFGSYRLGVYNPGGQRARGARAHADCLFQARILIRLWSRLNISNERTSLATSLQRLSEWRRKAPSKN